MKAELTAHVVSSSKCNDSYGEDCYSQIALLVFCFVCWAKEKKHVRGSSVGSSGVAGAGSLCILPRQAEIFVKNLIMLRRDAIFSSKELLESCKIITFPLLVCSHSICGQGYLKGSGSPDIWPFSYASSFHCLISSAVFKPGRGGRTSSCSRSPAVELDGEIWGFKRVWSVFTV